jgi:hypothetical protein
VAYIDNVKFAAYISYPELGPLKNEWLSLLDETSRSRIAPYQTQCKDVLMANGSASECVFFAFVLTIALLVSLPLFFEDTTRNVRDRLHYQVSPALHIGY